MVSRPHEMDPRVVREVAAKVDDPHDDAGATIAIGDRRHCLRIDAHLNHRFRQRRIDSQGGLQAHHVRKHQHL
jgi:hypothetical protein